MVRSSSSTCGGFAPQGVPGGVDGVLHGGEVAHCEHRPGRLRHQSDRCRGHDRERALGSDHELGEVERRPGREPVESVPARSSPERRKAGGDGVRVRLDQARQLAVDRGEQTGAGGAALPFSLVDDAERGGGAVGEDDVHLLDVVDRHAVAERAAAGRVVADHAADGRPVARRGVGTEHQTVRSGRAVEVVLDHARFDQGRTGLPVDAPDRVHVPGEVQHETRTYRLAREARAGAAGEDGQAGLTGQAHAVATSSAWRG